MPWVATPEPEGLKTSWRSGLLVELFRSYDSPAKGLPEDPLKACRWLTSDCTVSPSVSFTNESFSFRSSASIPVRISLPPPFRKLVRFVRSVDVRFLVMPPVLGSKTEYGAWPVTHTKVLLVSKDEE